jgi:hypothetical protein
MIRKLARCFPLFCFCLAFLLQVNRFQLVTLASTQPARSAPLSLNCPGYWYVSYGGTTNYTLLRVDPDGVPIEALRFDHGYSDPLAPVMGYLDFDGDGKSDVFSLKLRPDGLYQWRYSSGGVSDWIDMAYDARPLSDLRFGRFDNNFKSDVFGWRYLSSGAYRWMYSADGYGAWQDLAYSYDFPWTLGFGDFNADNVTDVFAAESNGAGQYNWVYSSGGAQNYQSFFLSPTLMDFGPSDLRFGDAVGYFNNPDPEKGDGYTDVLFVTTGNLAGIPAFAWRSPNYGINTTMGQETNLNNIRLGDFNNDRSTDIFYVAQRPDGFYQWYYLPFGRLDPVAMAYAVQPISDLQLGDFNGDGYSDVFTVVHTCRTWLPLVDNQ